MTAANLEHFQQWGENARVTRRAFVSGMATTGLLDARARNGSGARVTPADIALRIEDAQIEVAHGRTVATTTYKGAAPGEPIRMREGVPVSVEVFNSTDVPDYVHWHGFEISAELDGTPEEGSLAAPPNG